MVDGTRGMASRVGSCSEASQGGSTRFKVEESGARAHIWISSESSTEEVKELM